MKTAYLPIVTLSPMMVGKTFPLRLDFATCTRELSCIFVPDPTRMLFTSPEQKYKRKHQHREQYKGEEENRKDINRKEMLVKDKLRTAKLLYVNLK